MTEAWCNSAQTFISTSGMEMAKWFDSFLTVSLILSLVNLSWQKVASCHDGLAIHAYWIPVEGQNDISSRGLPVQLTGPKTRSLRSEHGLLIADVSETTYLKCREEGACYLQQLDILGTPLLVSYVGWGNVFRVLDRTKFPFGVGGWNNRLEPFVSVASSNLSPGTKLFVKELVNVKLPIGELYHNGCVRVDDVGPSACSLSFFAGYYDFYAKLQSTLSGQVHAEERACEILGYYSHLGASKDLSK